MPTSPTIAALAAALVKTQSALSGAKKDSTNPHFKTAYADLASVWDACRAPLANAGLSIVQLVSSDPTHAIIETIDPKKSYTATFQTEAGEIVIQLFAAKAPVTVNNFVFLARQGFYDGTTFHRVIPGFMAQGGDRTGSGSGGPGYRFQDEFNNGMAFDRAGLLAMANAGPGTNGSQFFITYAATPHLTNKHTIFGEVTSGLDNALAIRTRDPGSDKNPGVVLQSVTITEQ